MSCPHSTRPTAGPCSQCLGATPQLIAQQGPLVLIDGKPAGRGLDRETQRATNYYSKRGGLKHGRRRQG